MAHDEDGPRLSAVVERQRRELARVRADRDAAAVVAMARGVLMERHGWSSAEGARQLAAMATAAGLPEPEMAAAVLAQEPPSQPGQEQRASADPEAEEALGPAGDLVTIAAAERAKDGAELVGALAEQLRARLGVSAKAETTSGRAARWRWIRLPTARLRK